MPSRYGGLKRWQWAIVLLLALGNALAFVGPAATAGAFVGSAIVLYALARVLVAANRGWGSAPEGES